MLEMNLPLPGCTWLSSTPELITLLDKKVTDAVANRFMQSLHDHHPYTPEVGIAIIA